jgi:hypothetical protein
MYSYEVLHCRMSFVLIVQARDIVLKMITRYGFSSSLRLFVPPVQDDISMMSQTCSLRVEDEIKVPHHIIVLCTCTRKEPLRLLCLCSAREKACTAVNCSTLCDDTLLLSMC